MSEEGILKWSSEGTCVPRQAWKYHQVAMLRVIPVVKDMYCSYNMAVKPKEAISTGLQHGRKMDCVVLTKRPSFSKWLKNFQECFWWSLIFTLTTSFYYFFKV